MSYDIGVIGGGSWGTALGMLLARNGRATALWDRDRAHVETMARTRENARYLPGVPLPEGLEPVSDLALAAAAEQVLVVVPSHAFREVLRSLRPHLSGQAGIFWATKGLERESGKLLHEVLAEELGPDRPAAVLSGPTFAGEVARALPTAATVASRWPELARAAAEALSNETFRAYTSEDVVGVQLGGAVKNVLAIAAGISDGLGFGANARAALVTRGLAEIMRLGIRMGGQPETFMGLAGMGDLVLTCTDDQSRNRRFGLALARGLSQAEARAEIGQVVEGVGTAPVVMKLAREHGVELPITAEVYRLLYEGGDPAGAVHRLFTRAVKPEFG